MIQIELTASEVQHLRMVLNSWSPASKQGRVTKAENRVSDQILAKLGTDPQIKQTRGPLIEAPPRPSNSTDIENLFRR